MRLQRLCFEPRGNFFVALTNEGAFRVPNTRNGWAQRSLWAHSVICKPVEQVQSWLAFLGMVQVPAPHVGGCNCMGRR